MAVSNWFPGFPWEQQHRANYDKRSLLSVVSNVKTPTLIMTGEEDFRTPMSESEQYYKALKLRGVEAAKRLGVRQMRAGNDSLNAPMLAINRKLGYVPVAGEYEVVWARAVPS